MRPPVMKDGRKEQPTARENYDLASELLSKLELELQDLRGFPDFNVALVAEFNGVLAAIKAELQATRLGADE